MTGIARFELLEKLDHSLDQSPGSLMRRYAAALATLLKQEKAEWERVRGRMNKICAEASAKNIAVLVDAEETWIQDPVDVLCIQMMAEYNKEKVSCIQYRATLPARPPVLFERHAGSSAAEGFCTWC